MQGLEEFGEREDHEQLLNSVLEQSHDDQLHHELLNPQLHDEPLNPVLRQRLGDHSVLLHETLVSAVLEENRRDHDVQRHESLLNSLLGQFLITSRDRSSRNRCRTHLCLHTASECSATFTTEFFATVFCDAVMNLPAFAATDTAPECSATFATEFSATVFCDAEPTFSAASENAENPVLGKNQKTSTTTSTFDTAMNWNVNGLLDRMLLDDTGRRRNQRQFHQLFHQRRLAGYGALRNDLSWVKTKGKTHGENMGAVSELQCAIEKLQS